MIYSFELTLANGYDTVTQEIEVPDRYIKAFNDPYKAYSRCKTDFTNRTGFDPDILSVDEFYDLLDEMNPYDYVQLIMNFDHGAVAVANWIRYDPWHPRIRIIFFKDKFLQLLHAFSFGDKLK